MPRRGRRGQGTVFWSKRDRRWIARYPLGVVDGKRTSRRAKCRTRDDADAQLDTFRRLYGAGGHPANETLGDYLDRWLPEHRDIRESTRTSYAGHIRLYIKPLLGGIPLGKLQVVDVRRLIADLERRGKSAGTIHLVIRTLSAALGQAVSDRIIADNATMGAKLPRIDRAPVKALTDEGADAILEAVTGHWVERVVRVWLGSGLRRGEVLGLDQRDIGDGFVRVRVSKTHVRAVPTTNDATSALREAIALAPRRGPDEPVFFSPRTGDRMRGDSVTHALRQLTGLTPHALRHGAATLMLQAGHPMRVIAEQLGHRNPALTARIYAHVIPEQQRSAVASLERRRGRQGSR